MCEKLPAYWRKLLLAHRRGRDVAVEAEEVVRVVAVLELHQTVATPHRYERPTAQWLRDCWQGREVRERNRRGHLVGERIDPPVIELKHLRCPLQRAEEVPTEDRRKGVESELKRSDDPEVAPAALEAPEEVRVLVGAHLEQLTIGGYHVGLAHALGVEAVLAPQPGETPAHGVADHAHPGGGAHQPRKPENLRFSHHVAPQRT